MVKAAGGTVLRFVNSVKQLREGCVQITNSSAGILVFALDAERRGNLHM